MKKFILLLLILSSCVSHKQLERTILVSFYDFREYTENGFFLSPDPYIGEFKPVGMIDIYIYPGEKIELTKGYYDMFGNEIKCETLVKENISGKECVKILVDHAKKMGANGISNFKAITHYKTIIDKYSTTVKIEKYEVSGFAIIINKFHLDNNKHN